MTIKRLLCGALAGLPLLMMGRPATPELISVTNPDGTVIQIRMHGNEDFHYLTDADCKNILEKNAQGNLVPAMRNGRIMTTAAADINLLRSECISVMPMRNEAVNRMAALDDLGRSTYPTKGDVNALVILLEYADTPFSMPDPKAAFTKLCNEKGYSDFNSVGSARDYFIDASNGNFRPTFDVYGPIKLKYPSYYYVGLDEYGQKVPGLKDAGKTGRFGVAIEEAVKALDDEIDFSKYDLDKNGIIDNIFFFYSGYGAADYGTDPNGYATIWPHQADFKRYTKDYNPEVGLDPLYADGVMMDTYACSNELNNSLQIPADQKPYLDGIGAFVHEYGHVLGLPDLYDTSGGRTSTPGYFDVMDHGSYNFLSARPPMYSAYEKWVCNWLEYEDAVEGESYVLPSISTGEHAKAVRARVRMPGGGVRYTKEYFIFESRTAEGWDASLEQDGLVIWHIDYDKSKWTNNIVNINGRPCLDLVRPNSSNIVVFPGDENEYSFITPDSPYALVPYNYAQGFKAWISNIKYDPETKSASFDYNKYKEMPSDVTVMHDRPEAEHAKRNIHLRWDAVEGATDYYLTIQVENALGKLETYGSYKNFSTEGANHASILNVPEVYWDRNFSAFVTVVKNYPSTATSNVITFVPKDLPEGTKVETVEGDRLNVYGLRGRIEAPAGARVFNLSGVETGTENLPAGIYIVTAGEKTAKVIVK